MKIIVNNFLHHDKSASSIKILELNYSDINDDAKIFTIKSNEIPIIKVIDTGSLYIIDKLYLKLIQKQCESEILIHLSDLILLTSSSGEGGTLPLLSLNEFIVGGSNGNEIRRLNADDWSDFPEGAPTTGNWMAAYIPENPNPDVKLGFLEVRFEDAKPNTVVFRNPENGAVKVADPVDDLDAINKQWFLLNQRDGESALWIPGVGINSITTFIGDNIVDGRFSIAIGENNEIDGTYAQVYGKDNLAENDYTYVSGEDNQATEEYAYTRGRGNLATANHAYANGVFSKADGDHSKAFGRSCEAKSSGSIADGYYAIAHGQYTVSQGYEVTAEGEFARVNGKNSTSNGNFSQVSGESCNSQGDYSYARGHFVEALNSCTSATGQYTRALGENSFVHGANSEVSGINSIVLGANIIGAEADTTYVDNLNIKSLRSTESVKNLGLDSDGHVVEGKSHSEYVFGFESEGQLGNTLTIGHGIGKLRLTNGENTVVALDGAIFDLHTFGSPYHRGKVTIILPNGIRRYIDLGAIVDTENGLLSEIFSDTRGDALLGVVWEDPTGDYKYYPYFIGEATGGYSYTNGKQTIASGYSSYAIGWKTWASGEYSYAEGDETIASGDHAHAEGDGTTAEGHTSHAEGKDTVAMGPFSHAQGRGSQANGAHSHAEGDFSIANGDAGHAEGSETNAGGVASHSQNQNTSAVGNYSHSGGHTTFANGEGSFVHGRNSSANGNYTIVLGSDIVGEVPNTVYLPNLIISQIAEYSDHEAVDANVDIPSKSVYKLVADRTLYIKP